MRGFPVKRLAGKTMIHFCIYFFRSHNGKPFYQGSAFACTDYIVSIGEGHQKITAAGKILYVLAWFFAFSWSFFFLRICFTQAHSDDVLSSYLRVCHMWICPSVVSFQPSLKLELQNFVDIICGIRHYPKSYFTLVNHGWNKLQIFKCGKKFAYVLHQPIAVTYMEILMR